MHEIINDTFFDLIKRYDQYGEDHFAGEVGYYLLTYNEPYEGLDSHREALNAVFEGLVEKSIEHREKVRIDLGDRVADKFHPWVYDIEKAQATPLAPSDFFYCPDIVRIDSNGCVFYDAEWVPNDDNFGTTVPYWYAVMEPVQGRRNKPEDFKKINEVLFPKGTDTLEVFEWTTDWSDYFDDGHEWYGACCWSIYDRNMDRYAVLIVSAID
jgi:hypothetical protein